VIGAVRDRRLAVRLVEGADADVIDRLLHDFNSEFGDPRPARERQRAGRALMEAAIDVARHDGAAEMHLGTAEADVAARESLGFSNREGKPSGAVNYFYQREL
jgi:GNAT superfamily N-acetyltransferase